MQSNKTNSCSEKVTNYCFYSIKGGNYITHTKGVNGTETLNGR